MLVSRKVTTLGILCFVAVESQRKPGAGGRIGDYIFLVWYSPKLAFLECRRNPKCINAFMRCFVSQFIRQSESEETRDFWIPVQRHTET